MIWLSLDFETTGLDVNNDRPIEVGAILWSTGQHKILEAADFLVKSDVPIPKEITDITSIHQIAVDRFGFDSPSAVDNVLAMLELSDAVIGHNIKRFDKRVLESWCLREKRLLGDKLYIDTMTDLSQEGKKLGYMALEAPRPFINPFPHSAFADALTVICLADQYDTDLIVKRAKSPTLVVQSHQARNANDDAKKFKFRWNPDRKIWWKAIKAIDFEEYQKYNMPFEISVRQDLHVEDLWTD
jgi:Exonuclease